MAIVRFIPKDDDPEEKILYAKLRMKGEYFYRKYQFFEDRPRKRWTVFPVRRRTRSVSGRS
jgi:hypothetical protein